MQWIEYFFGHEIWHWLMIGVLVFSGIACMIEFPNRLGAIGGMLLLSSAVVVVAYDEGFRAAHNDEAVIELKHQLAQQAAIIKEREDEAKAAKQVSDNASQRERAAATQADQLQQKVDDYAAKLKKRPVCDATDADVRGMQSIGGSPDQARPAGAPGNVWHPIPPPRPQEGR